VAAGHAGAGLQDLVISAAQDLLEQSHVQRLGRKHHQVERQNRPPPHGIDVRKRVGGSDLPEPVGIVHRRRDEIHRADDRRIGRQAVDRRVVAGVETDQQIFIRGDRQFLQRVRQIRRTDFGGSPAGTGHAHEGFLFPEKHVGSLSLTDPRGRAYMPPRLCPYIATKLSLKQMEINYLFDVPHREHRSTDRSFCPGGSVFV